MIEKLPVFSATLPVAATDSNMQVVCSKINEMIDAINRLESTTVKKNTMTTTSSYDLSTRK